MGRVEIDFEALMRILHLVHNFPPEFRGGTEQYVASLAVRQRDVGNQVTVVCGSDQGSGAADSASHPWTEEAWQGVSVKRLKRTVDEPFGVLFRPPRLAKAVTDWVRTYQPDLVHLHHWFQLGDEILSTLPDCPVVASLHDSYVACPRFFFLRPDGGYCGSDLPVPVSRCVDCVGVDDGEANLSGRLEERRAGFQRELGRVSVALAPSHYHADVLRRSGVVPGELLRVLPLGIAPLQSGPRQDRAGGPLRLVNFGNLSRIKGIDALLRVAAKLPPERFRLDLYGSRAADDAQLLEALAEGLPVTFHGAYDRTDLAAQAGKFDLAVFPSRAFETYSLVVEEAVALGVPVVVSDRGALPERVGDFGRVVSMQDDRSLEQTLKELVERPELVDALRREIPETYQDVNTHEEQLAAIYREVIP